MRYIIPEHQQIQAPLPINSLIETLLGEPSSLTEYSLLSFTDSHLLNSYIMNKEIKAHRRSNAKDKRP